MLHTVMLTLMQYPYTCMFTEDNTQQDINVDIEQLQSQTQSQSMLKRINKSTSETSSKVGLPLKQPAPKRGFQTDKSEDGKKTVVNKKSRLSLGPSTSKEELISSSRMNVRGQKLSVDESSGLEDLFGTPRVSTIKLRHDTSSSDASVFTTGNVLKKAKVDPKPTGEEDKDLIDVQLLSIQTSLCENVEKLNKNAERIAIACEGISNRVETGNAYWKSIADYMNIKIKDHEREVEENVDQKVDTNVEDDTADDQELHSPSDENTDASDNIDNYTSIQEDDLKDKSPESITF